MVGCETHFFFAEMENEIYKIIYSFFEKTRYGIIDLIERGEKGTKVIEIFVDSEEPINIDELAKMNRELNDLIDSQEIIPDISKLVVSSPGTERSFKFIWQLKKHIGRLLEIELNSGEKIEGILTEADNESSGLVMVNILRKEKGKKITEELRVFKFSDIKESRVKISFSK